MVLSDFSIKRPLVTVVVILMLMALGLLALKKLRVNEIPDVEQPVLVVQVAYPGASPETVEREIINRLERAMQGISGIYEVRSTAKDGVATIVLIFNFSKNMIEAVDDVRNAISTVRYKLPLEMREPVIQRQDPSAQPVIELALSSTSQGQAAISRLAEDDLAERLRAVDGAAVVEVTGSLKRELSVLLHADRLREYGISVSEVVDAVRSQNANAPVGRVIGPLKDQSIRLVGRIESPSEFQQVIVRRRGNEIVRLGQLADTVDGFADVESISLRNGHPNVLLSVTRTREASTVAVAARVRKLVKDIQPTLPAGTKLEVIRDGGVDAEANLDNVIEALALGAMLTVTVVYVFLNSWRSTLITALSLPTSAITAFIAVWLCGFSLNIMTLLGLSLAIGVLIDDAIVVRENIVRHMERGADRRTAASVGTAEIGMAVAATTFSIIAIFLPVVFMPGVAGEWFRPFALTVACSVLVSLFVSFTLDPMISAYWGDPPPHLRPPRSRLGRALERFNAWFDHQADRYGNVIAWALHHRRWMAAAAFGSFVAALALHALFGGSSFLPQQDAGMIAVEVRTPASASLAYAQLKVEKAAELARTLKEAKATNSQVNAGGGRVYVDLGKRTERSRSAAEVAVELRHKVARLAGAEYVVLDDLNNGTRKPVQIQFYGQDARTLLDITNAYMDRLRQQVKGAVDVGLSELPPKDELRVELDRGLANQLGISANDAAQALRVAFAGVEVGDWVDPGGEARDVSVRLHKDDRVDAENLERLPVAVGTTGMVVPLNQVARITMGSAPAQIQHLDGRRMIAVSANVEGRASGDVIKDALALAQQASYPPGYGVVLGGSGKDQQEVFGAMTTALAMGVGLMYLILVMQFGSFTAPIGVMLSLPLSLVGVVLALLATHTTLNLMSFIGVIMLMGLVAKNAILLLDATRAREAAGEEREAALMAAGRARLRPILMTTFALIAGMLPVAIGAGEGGEFYRPLAIAIIGGTTTSTLLTLLVVPAFYDSIEIARDRLVAKFRQRSERGNALWAGVQTGIEALLTLVMLRWLWRGVRSLAMRTHVAG